MDTLSVVTKNYVLVVATVILVILLIVWILFLLKARSSIRSRQDCLEAKLS